MLNKLTKDQEAFIPVVKDEWLKFCLGGETSLNRKLAMDGIRWIYGLAKKESPFVIFINGPMQCQMAVWFLKTWLKEKKNWDQVGRQVWGQVGGQVGEQVGDQVWGQVRDQVWGQVGGQVRDQVWGQVREQVRDQVGGQVGDQVGDQVREQVRDQVWGQVGGQVRDQVRDQVWGQVWGQVGEQVGDQVREQVGEQVREQVGEQVREQVWEQVGGQVRDQVGGQVKKMKQEFYEYSYCSSAWDAGWVSFYDYFKRIGIKVTKDYERYDEYTRTGVFMSIFLEGFAICCPRPKSVYKLTNGRLHNENGPALSWEGEDYWFLNGIRVPEWLVKTDSGQIDPKLALTEKNVDIQREIIRKVGAERMLKACNAETLDVFVDKHTKGGNEYKLMRMKIGNIDRKYLYFEHASLPGVWYAQPVHPELKTALESRAWMLGVIEHDSKYSEKELLECLPINVS